MFKFFTNRKKKNSDSIQQSEKIDLPIEKISNAILKEEIISFNLLLSNFGITFNKLSKISPKHTETRYELINMAKQIAQNEHATKLMYETKSIPIGVIEELLDVDKKLVKKNIEFLTAMTVLYTKKFAHLTNYIHF